MTTACSTISIRSARTRPAGFTLMEILIALSIFGAGLVMAACLFPAAVSEHEKAVEYTLGTIMCSNGVVMARTQLRHNETAGTPTDTNAILNKLQSYPSTKANPFFQFMIKCEHATKVVDPVTGKYPNTYTVTVTPYKAGTPFPGTPTPSWTINTPLGQ